MITEKDLEEAIAECQGQRNPNASTCMKLAAFYTIRREMFGGMSYAPPPPDEAVTYQSESEFAEAIRGMDTTKVLTIIDELMEAVKVLLPRLYDSVMRKLRAE